MNREQLQKDFFPTEIMHNLFKNELQLRDKIKLINNYIDKVRDSYDADVLHIMQNNQIALTYWMSEQYSQAIAYFELAVEKMKPEEDPSKYILALNLLIRGNRLLSNYQEAEKWVSLAFETTDIFHSFENLAILNDYADLITDTGQTFDENHIPLIQSIIRELGFPEKLDDPIETIRSMTKRNKLWNRKLSEWTIKFGESELDVSMKELEKYIDSCEIEWYRDYAKDSLEKLKSKSQ